MSQESVFQVRRPLIVDQPPLLDFLGPWFGRRRVHWQGASGCLAAVLNELGGHGHIENHGNHGADKQHRIIDFLPGGKGSSNRSQSLQANSHDGELPGRLVGVVGVQLRQPRGDPEQDCGRLDRRQVRGWNTGIQCPGSKEVDGERDEQLRDLSVVVKDQGKNHQVLNGNEELLAISRERVCVPDVVYQGNGERDGFKQV